MNNEETRESDAVPPPSQTFLFHGYRECLLRVQGEEVRLRRFADDGWLCPVCGNPIGDRPPWNPEDGNPSMERCRACATQYGVEDLAPPGELVLQWQRLREEWLDNGGWADRQLALLTNLGFDYEDNNELKTAAELFRCALSGAVMKVRLLLTRGVPADEPSPFGETALMKAAGRSRGDVLAELLQRGADVNRQDKLGRTAVRRAWSPDLVRQLARAGADLNLPDWRDETLLMDWARQGSPEFLEFLISSGGDPHSTGWEGRTPVWVSVANPPGLAVMLKHGGDPNQPAGRGMTPLMRAVALGSLEAGRMLLDAGAAPSAQDDAGQTALIHAARQGSWELAELLLAAGADVNLVDEGGWHALFHAIERGNRAIVRKLLHAGSSVTLRDFRNATPMQFAMERNDSEVARMIAEAGAEE